MNPDRKFPLSSEEQTRILSLYKQYVDTSKNVNTPNESKRRLVKFKTQLKSQDFAHFRKGADLGMTEAMCLLAASFIEGWIEKNQTAGFEWLKKAAEFGNAYAQQTIGGLYEHGATPNIAMVGGNRKEALRWYKLAAEQGEPRAQSALGLIYFQGIEMKEGFRLLNLAADQGIWSAMFNVALFYEQGRYIEKDRPEALRRYRILARQGHKKAKGKVRELGGPWWRRIFTDKPAREK